MDVESTKTIWPIYITCLWLVTSWQGLDIYWCNFCPWPGKSTSSWRFHFWDLVPTSISRLVLLQWAVVKNTRFWYSNCTICNKILQAILLGKFLTPQHCSRFIYVVNSWKKEWRKTSTVTHVAQYGYIPTRVSLLIWDEAFLNGNPEPNWSTRFEGSWAARQMLWFFGLSVMRSNSA